MVSAFSLGAVPVACPRLSLWPVPACPRGPVPACPRGLPPIPVVPPQEAEHCPHLLCFLLLSAPDLLVMDARSEVSETLGIFVLVESSVG